MLGARAAQLDARSRRSAPRARRSGRDSPRRWSATARAARQRSRKRRPPTPKRSATGARSPCWKRIACTRFLSEVRLCTRCSRKRARSRSPRTTGPGSQISGTRSRRASSANTQASIRSVLHAKRCDPLRPLRVRDPHIPASQLKLVVHEPRARHRLDRRQHRLAMLALDPCTKCASPSRSGGHAPSPTRSPSDGERVPIETLATEIQSDVQHPWASLVDDPPESLRRAGGPSSSDSLS